MPTATPTALGCYGWEEVAAWLELNGKEAFKPKHVAQAQGLAKG